MLIRKLLSVFKTIIFNLHYFNLSVSVKCPIYIGYDVKIMSWGKKGSIELEKVKRGIVSIGIEKGSFTLGSERKSCISIGKNAKIIFKGDALFAQGINLIVGENGEIICSDGFACNASCLINASKRIILGENALFGWNCSILDGDGHSICDKNNPDKVINESKEIDIGNNVWLASNVTVLKGVKIGNGNIVASNSVITKTFNCEGNIIGGNPSRILKENVIWFN